MSSDNWKTAQQTEIEATGIQPADDAESAIVADLPPGLYTAVVAGKAIAVSAWSRFTIFGNRRVTVGRNATAPDTGVYSLFGRSLRLRK